MIEKLTKFIRICLILIIVIIPLAYRKGLDSSFTVLTTVSKEFLLETFLFTTFLILLWHGWVLLPVKSFTEPVTRGRRLLSLVSPRYKNKLTYAIILFLIISLLSTLFSQDGYTSQQSLIHLFSLFLLFLLTTSLPWHILKPERIIIALIINASFISLYGILQHFGFDPLLLNPDQEIPVTEAVNSTFANRNVLAGFIVFVLPLTIAYIISVLKKDYRNPSRLSSKEGSVQTEYSRLLKLRKLFLLILCFLLQLIALLFSYTRGAWLGIIGAGFFFTTVFLYQSKKTASFSHKAISVTLTRHARHRRILITLTMLLALALAVKIDYQRSRSFTRRFLSITKVETGSIAHRFVMWKTALAMLRKNHWLGTGSGTFATIHPYYQGKFMTPAQESKKPFMLLSVHAHNDYLQIAAETGFLGLAAFLYLIATCFVTGFARIKKNNLEPSRYIFTIAFLASITGTLIHSFFHYSWEMPATSMLLWFSFGLLANDDKTIARSRPPSPRVRLITVFCYLILMTAITRPLIGRLCFEKGYAYDQMGSEETAIRLYEKATQIDLHQVRAFNNLGLIYQKNGLCQKAITCFLNTLRSNPLLTQAYSNLASAYVASGELGKAGEAYQKALLVGPNFTTPYTGLGSVYLKLGELAKAQATLEEASRRFPHEARILANLGSIYLAQGKIEESQAQFEQALHLDPDQPGIHFNLGLIYSRQHNWEKAEQEHQKALQINPYFIEAYNALGICYAEQGELPKAIQQWELALKIAPDNQSIKANIARARKITSGTD